MGTSLNPLVSVAETVPAMVVVVPTLSVTVVFVRLLASSVLSVTTAIPVKESGDAVLSPSAGVTDTILGPGHAVLAASVVAAVELVPLGQVTVTVVGVGGGVDPPPPPPPQAERSATAMAAMKNPVNFVFMPDSFPVLSSRSPPEMERRFLWCLLARAALLLLVPYVAKSRR